jgi:hypothetical protein
LLRVFLHLHIYQNKRYKFIIFDYTQEPFLHSFALLWSRSMFCKYRLDIFRDPSWPWSYGSWIYNYLCNHCLSQLILWVRISTRARCTTLCDKVCQWLATGRWFSPDPPVSSNYKTDRHDITEILSKVALNTIKPNLDIYQCHYPNSYAKNWIKS